MEIDFSHLHHAYLIGGNQERSEALLRTLLVREGIQLAGSPDFFPLKEPVFGVDTARQLSVLANRTAFTGKKIFLIVPESITLEAQNALLKTFEEPVRDTHFFLLVRDVRVIIPTLLSRMHVISAGGEEDGLLASTFFTGSLKERLSWVKKFVDQEKSLPAFLDSLLLELRRAGKTASLPAVFKMRQVADQRASSARLILEHLAAVL